MRSKKTTFDKKCDFLLHVNFKFCMSPTTMCAHRYYIIFLTVSQWQSLMTSQVSVAIHHYMGTTVQHMHVIRNYLSVESAAEVWSQAAVRHQHDVSN